MSYGDFLGILIQFCFFGIPLALFVLVAICIYRYVSAKVKNKAVPETFSYGEIKERKILMIVTSAIFTVIAAVVVGFVVLLAQAIAYM